MATIYPVALALFCVSQAAAQIPRRLGATPSVSAVEGNVSSAPTGISLVSRTYVPYDNSNLAFGMGACEQIAYDSVEKYAYAASEQGFVNIIDFNVPASPVVTSYSFQPGSVLTDIEICGDMLFVSVAGSSNELNGQVKIYATTKRASPAAPVISSTVTVGPLPDMVLPNNACSKVAVANEGEGVYHSTLGLIDPVGSVSIISDLTATAPTVTHVSLASVCADDAACIALGVHLPLQLKAMEYFDLHSAKFANKLNFSTARAAYTTDTQFEPEYVAWSADDSTIYANLQENSAVVTIDASSGTATSIKAYGLKDWSSSGGTLGIDTVKDNTCILAHKPGFKSMRNPDAIAAFSLGGTGYLVTADEGDDKEYGDFAEKQKFNDVIDGANAFNSGFAEFTAGPGMVDAVTNFDGTKMAVTIGSEAVDYSNPSAPVFRAAVGFGGRGVTIYRTSDMSIVWHSGSDFEKKQCQYVPWAHNGVQDEEFSPVSGPGNALYVSTSNTSKLAEDLVKMNDPAEDGCSDSGNGSPGACPLNMTIDERSLKDGAGPEAVVVGYACGRMLMVTATEKQGTAFVYDVSDPASPTFLFVQPLSPASQLKSPGVAYADKTLGDIDPESSIFLEASKSPTGNAGIMFGGAWSGTISFYEFQGCTEPAPAQDDGSVAYAPIPIGAMFITTAILFIFS